MLPCWRFPNFVTSVYMHVVGFCRSAFSLVFTKRVVLGVIMEFRSSRFLSIILRSHVHCVALMHGYIQDNFSTEMKVHCNQWIPSTGLQISLSVLTLIRPGVICISHISLLRLVIFGRTARLWSNYRQCSVLPHLISPFSSLTLINATLFFYTTLPVNFSDHHRARTYKRRPRSS